MPVKYFTSLEECQKVCTTVQNQLIVIDFTATWCGPCRMISPVYERLSNEYPNVLFYKVDVDQVPDLTQHFNVQGMPTFVFIVNNEIKKQFAGANSDLLTKTVKELYDSLQQ